MTQTPQGKAELDAAREEEERRTKAAADFKMGKEIADKLPAAMRRTDR